MLDQAAGFGPVAAALDQVGQGAGRARASVVVVSDDAAMREAMVMLLHVEGFVVRATDAAHGEEAARLLPRGAPVPRCAVIDEQDLESAAGLKLAARLAQPRLGGGPGFRVVMLASAPTAGYRRRAARAGATSVLEKPAAGQAIVLSVTAALDDTLPRAAPIRPAF